MSFKFVTVSRNWWPGYVAVVVAGMGGIGAGQYLIKLAGISPISGEMRCRRL
jgi:hypothetical protein